MYRSRMVTLAITTIATLFCSALILTAQPTPEEKQTTEVELPSRSTKYPRASETRNSESRNTRGLHGKGNRGKGIG